mmetsp:Transcript_22431/g.42031  ORF Transcript_22431/g.42031 Transcript_22431/m.42031 type:complete len:494 (-) Transcript_22431:94-1575(-)|eukprot:CAMPEP_0184537626 /NCGR_PEP_ID=MMETSP0198_2-20121128/17139_1 /TAXON_ID=1112570 /ORGANISM="Thraustochytrium sp., Strain LLF1b" /LENGTH=493 /DNA_ID=CAMNT_0026930979 /DNA_START=66 /DNA_END=1547 /DNA_ORIENTATION=+
MTTPLMDLSLTALAHEIQSGKVTPLDAVEACFARIEERDKALGAVVVICKESALAVAKEQTERMRRGERVGPLAGIPFAVKDLEDAQGLVTSFGCKAIAARNQPAKTSSVQVQRLCAQGAIVVGKTNAPIFGTTILSKNDVFGITRNPWDPMLTPGGSSGGSSSAVAARMMPFATAADGGGSIRCPASFTGLFGMKPTRGIIPMTEGIEFGMDRFLHCVSFGPLTRTVEDAAWLMDVTCGYHPDDPMSVPRPLKSFREAVRSAQKTCTPSKPLKVLFSSDLGFVSYIDPELLSRAKRAAQVFADMGHSIVVEDFGQAVKSILPDPEMRWPLGMGLQEKLMVLPSLSNEEQGQLEKSISLIWAGLEGLEADELGDIYRYSHELNRAIERIFSEFDLLLTPTMPIGPFKAEGPVAIDKFDFPLHVVGFLGVFNMSGHPAASVRLPECSSGADMGGLQIIAPRYQDHMVLEASALFEHLARPFESWPEPCLGTSRI